MSACPRIMNRQLLTSGGIECEAMKRKNMKGRENQRRQTGDMDLYESGLSLIVKMGDQDNPGRKERASGKEVHFPNKVEEKSEDAGIELQRKLRFLQEKWDKSSSQLLYALQGLPRRFGGGVPRGFRSWEVNSGGWSERTI